MNKKAKRRLVVVGGIIVIAMLVIAAVAGAGGASSSVGVVEVARGEYDGKKVQVSGTVLDGVEAEGSKAVFWLAPEEDADRKEPATGTVTVRVTYDGALPATFGAGITAICTGTAENGELIATEMVTKCPSKYESAEGSLTVKGLADQADSLAGKDVKVCGYVRGNIHDAQADYRFIIESQDESIAVVYEGGLDEAIADGTAVVVSGKLGEDGMLHASEQPSIDSSIKE